MVSSEEAPRKNPSECNQSPGLYVHVPYCRRRCLYCDFYSAGSRIADWPRLRASLLEELDERKHEMATAPGTLYIGGGTPSMMPSDEFAKLIGGIGKRCDLSGVEEFTLEVNPDDVEICKVEEWRACGVNRVSLGVQAFDDKLLKSLGRLHDAASARRALQLLAGRFPEISVDLIFGLPGQSLAGWKSDINEALAFDGVTHLSAYSLMYEERTALTVLRDSGRIKEADEGGSVEMYEQLIEEAARYGFVRYELSNYSKPEHESRHNSSYWKGAPYLGLGPSAHSYDGERVRRANRADVAEYLRRFGSRTDIKSRDAFYEEEILSEDELREEMVLTRLRLREGMDMEIFRSRFGSSAAEELLRNAYRHKKFGNLKIGDGRVALTDKGVMVADSVIADLM